jgi:hypothetical protein
MLSHCNDSCRLPGDLLFCQLCVLLVVLVSCARPSFGQFVLNDSGSAYNVATDPPPAERFLRNHFNDAKKVTANLQTILDKQNLAPGGIAVPLFVPGGFYYVDGTIYVGINAAGKQSRSGGSFTGTSSMGNFLTANHIPVNLGAETRFCDTATFRQPDGAIIPGATMVFGGAGWTIGNFSLHGSLLPNQTAWLQRTTHAKREIGLWIKSYNLNGQSAKHLFAGPIQFMNYVDAIRIEPNQGNSTLGNNTYWQYIGCDSCDTCFHVNDAQSVTHEIYALDMAINTVRGIYMERGGQIHVHSGTSLWPNQLLAEIGDNYHVNYGDLIIENWKFDNLGRNITVLKLGKPLPGQPRSVSITGSIGAAQNLLNPAGACQGILPTDKIFINVTGNPRNAAILNDFSTVDADGNFREKIFTIQVSGPGADLAVGDAEAYFAVPKQLNGWRLHDVAASLDVASMSGSPTIQLRRRRAGVDADMLATELTIAANETDSSSAPAAVFDPSNDDVATGDRIYVDCNASGTGARWLNLTLTFRRY